MTRSNLNSNPPAHGKPKGAAARPAPAEGDEGEPEEDGGSPGEKPAAAPKAKAAGKAKGKAKAKGGSIFDRLTDSSQYTGSHKNRFNADGTGRGKAGRDPGVDSQTADLSQMTRNWSYDRSDFLFI